jgi:hypothetical protein
MRRGALAMLDALGFKGIWERSAPDAVMKKLADLRAVVKTTADDHKRGIAALTKRDGKPLQDLEIEVQFLSDTIVLGVSCTPADKTCVAIASYLSSHVLALAAEQPPALALRGSIAFGDYLINDNFIVGRAVDDAASHMDLAEGAFVWLAPSARQLVPRAKLSWSKFLLPHRVPMKGGGSYLTPVVVPFASSDSDEERDKVSLAILGTFTSGNMSIEIKRQNTTRFLKSARGRIALALAAASKRATEK